MLGINLIMTVALQDFVGTGGGVLRAFGKTFKTHHSGLNLLLTASCFHCRSDRGHSMRMGKGYKSLTFAVYPKHVRNSFASCK